MKSHDSPSQHTLLTAFVITLLISFIVAFRLDSASQYFQCFLALHRQRS